MSTTTPPPKSTNLDAHLQGGGNSILHQKAARAAELHAELNALLESQAKRRADEANRPFGSGFLEFVKKSKSELINIFAAFTCVVLAWQIVNIRKGARKLLQNVEEMGQKLEEYQQILKILSSDEFIKGVEDSYRRKLEKDTRGGWVNEKKWFGKRVQQDKGVGAGADSDASVGAGSDMLSNILRAELCKVIGDRAMSTEELKEKKLMALQREMGLIQESKKHYKNDSGIGDVVRTKDQEVGGLEDILVEIVQDENNAQPSTRIVKRSKGFI
jgi:hypothetical protein